METQALEVNKVDDSIAIYSGASLLSISDKEQKKLLAAFDTNMIEIRPDGLIYLPQVFWRQRLNETFGIGQWCLIIKGNTKDPERSKLYLEGVLMVRGCYMATAVGEAEYHDNNKGQSWASVWESAKSDCITRCCKDLGIASLLWQPQFSQQWQQDNAAKVFVNNNGNSKAVWRKKDAKPFWNETGYCQDSPNIPQQPAQQQQPNTSKKQPLTVLPDVPDYIKTFDNLSPAEKEMQDEFLQLHFELWGEALAKCPTLHILTEVYKQHEVYVQSFPELLTLFTMRKNQLNQK